MTLIRAAAKNHSRVCVLSDPEDYHGFLDEIHNGEISESSRQKYVSFTLRRLSDAILNDFEALKAFEYIEEYDAAVADFFRRKYGQDRMLPLRYGINPHQSPASAYMKEAPLPFEILNGR